MQLLKLAYVPITRVVILTLLVIQLTFAYGNSALAQNTLTPETNSTESSEQVNRENRQQGTKIDQKQSEETSTQQQQSTSSVSSQRSSSNQPFDPYAKYYEGMKKFNDEVYGNKG